MIDRFAVLTASENYGNVIGDPNLACNFAIFFDDFVDFENLQNFQCQEFDATGCKKTTQAPVDVHNEEPTQAPSADRTSRPHPTASPVAPTLVPTRTVDPPTPSGAADGRSIAMFLSTAVATVVLYFAL
jgi:hypothetical protein